MNEIADAKIATISNRDWQVAIVDLELPPGFFVSLFYQKDHRCRTSNEAAASVGFDSINSHAIKCVSVVLLAALFGCAAKKDPPEATVSWLTPRTRAAKVGDCPMPLLSDMPNTDYQQIAVVEVAADYNEDRAEIERLARREACQTGADALVVTDEQRQKLGGTDHADSSQTNRVGGAQEPQHTPEVGEAGHKGSFFNGVAIIYGKATQ